MYIAITVCHVGWSLIEFHKGEYIWNHAENVKSTLYSTRLFLID